MQALSINLSILDFKNIHKHIINVIWCSINLSILDFKNTRH